MSLIANLVGTSGVGSNGASQTPNETSSGGTDETGSAGSGGATSGASSGGTTPASTNGSVPTNELPASQSIQAVERKDAARAALDLVAADEPSDLTRARARAQEASRALFYEKIVEGLSATVEAPDIIGAAETSDAEVGQGDRAGRSASNRFAYGETAVLP